MPTARATRNLAELFTDYIAECRFIRGLRPQTITGYEAVFDHFSNMMPEVITLESLTREKMVEFFKRIKTRTRIVGRDTPKVGLEDSTIKTYGNKLNAFFVWLVERELILRNPLDGIKLKYPEYNDQRALKTAEVHKIISAIILHPVNPLVLKRNIMMIDLLFYCGLRKGEFIGLKVTDLDMEKRQLTVRAETSKSKRSRTMPMNKTLVIHLQEYITERNRQNYRTEDLIVSSTEDTGLSVHGLKHWVKRLVKLSGVKFHLHRFRHSYACNLAMTKMGMIMIRDLMGHRSLKMTEVYLRSMEMENARADIDKLSIG
jgi:site-specific recombinase XerD